MKEKDTSFSPRETVEQFVARIKGQTAYIETFPKKERSAVARAFRNRGSSDLFFKP